VVYDEDYDAGFANYAADGEEEEPNCRIDDCTDGFVLDSDGNGVFLLAPAYLDRKYPYYERYDNA
jgi:hypothetical protein